MSYEISDTEFSVLSRMVYETSGIVLNDSKKVLLTGRLAKRLRALGLDTYTQYIKYIRDGHGGELDFMVDLLTTNETYFFREPQHFDYLRDAILPAIPPGQSFSVWSAAASIGAEAYTIAMVLADKLGVDGAWDILGTDISPTVLEQARRGHYKIGEVEKIPRDYVKKFCLKGVRSQEGTFLIDKRLRQHCRFEQMNLNVDNLRKPGEFDVIFLRNMLIYFDIQTKRRVVENLIPALKKNGLLIIGHAETLNGVTDQVRQVQPTVYRRP